MGEVLGGRAKAHSSPRTPTLDVAVKKTSGTAEARSAELAADDLKNGAGTWESGDVADELEVKYESGGRTSTIFLLWSPLYIGSYSQFYSNICFQSDPLYV